MARKRDYSEFELDGPGAATIDSTPKQKVKAGSLPKPDSETEDFLMHAVGSYQWAPIYDALHSMLDTKDRLALSATSRAFREALRDTIWCINKRLARFFEQPVDFRTQLGKSNALISGGFALQFLEGVTWKDSDLDIYVEGGQDSEAMEQYLLSAGYQKGSSRSTEASGRLVGLDHLFDTTGSLPISGSAVECTTYLKTVCNTDPAIMAKESQVKVKIIATRSIPIICIMNVFRSSCIVNIITWNKAYSIFPRATFLKHRTIALRSLSQFSPGTGALHAKYSKRGWRMWTHPVPFAVADDLVGGKKGCSDLEDECGPHRCRRIGDRDTWTLKLDTMGVRRPLLPDFVIECTNFAVCNLQDDDEDAMLVKDSALDIKIEPFESPVLRWRYADWCLQSIEEIFDRATEFQSGKATSQERALLFASDGSVNSSAKCNIDGWDYMDEEVPELLAEYLRNPDGIAREMGYIRTT
ncbi:hypothetical protein F5Y18DRAFT_438187 [Xylariaceae sp. FL1019]|nr:hypothetical protein F5Y18DRAFT_438187 [Xylariaceae sp. FL1019]